MMAHGFRGASEIAATLDHMAAFANLAGVVPGHLFDLYHDATLGRPDVVAFMQAENPAALAAMRDMFMQPSDKHRMKEALLSMLAGDIYGTTPIWKSIRLLKGAYYLLCAMNGKRSWMAWKKRKNDIIAIPGLLPQQTEY